MEAERRRVQADGWGPHPHRFHGGNGEVHLFTRALNVFLSTLVDFFSFFFFSFIRSPA